MGNRFLIRPNRKLDRPNQQVDSVEQATFPATTIPPVLSVTVLDDEAIEDVTIDRQSMSLAAELLRDRDFDLIKWRQAERTGVCTSFVSQMMIIIAWGMVMIAHNPWDAAPEIMTAIVCYGLSSLLLIVPIGFTSGIVAYYLFRRSTISISKMTIALTLLIEFAFIGWIIAIASHAG